MKREKEQKVLFCYTVVKVFKSLHRDEAALDFLENLRLHGATDKTILDLNKKRIAFWSEEDECQTAQHAVEIISR